MEHTKGSLGSQMQIQQQQQQQQQQNQSKKKSKNKKKSSKSDAVVTRPIDEQQQQQQHHQSSEGAVVQNGLTDQLKQQLHIGNNDNNTNLNNSSSSYSSSCSSNSNNNNNKVNGLMTENLKKSSKACLLPITNLQNDKKFKQQPALNGHHPVEQEEDTASATQNGIATMHNSPAVIAANKKSKRKPNNKKNANSIEDNNSKQLENGHCPLDIVTTNGFNHKEEDEEQQEQTVTNTAIKATSTSTTTNSTSTTTPTNSESVKGDSLGQQQLQQSNNTSLETISLSQNPKSVEELDLSNVHIEYKEYESELQMHDIMRLIQAELSEPYSIYTYRYFIYNWPKLCFLAAHGNEYVGAIVCKLDMHMNVRRGYIAMLAVRKEYRKLKIGTTLVQKAIEAMLADKADEVVLETEMSNLPALRLYENLGFVRDKRLFRYYLNGVDALRLKLWFR